MTTFDQSSIDRQIDNMRYIGGTTNIADGLQMAREKLLPQSRANSETIVIVITDGKYVKLCIVNTTQLVKSKIQFLHFYFYFLLLLCCFCFASQNN